MKKTLIYFIMFKKFIVGIAMISFSLALKIFDTTTNFPANTIFTNNLAGNSNSNSFGNGALLRRNRLQSGANAGNNNLDIQTNFASGDIRYVRNSMDQENTNIAN